MRSLILFSLLAVGVATRFYPLDQEVYMNSADILNRWGYPFRRYDVMTKDGYILPVYRMSHSRRAANACKKTTYRFPILLGHCLIGSSEQYMMNPPDSSISMLLADACLAVWVLNYRSTPYAYHANFSQADTAYWEWTWDAMVKYDLPAIVDKVLEKTRSKQLYYIGYSQGTTVMFAKLASDPYFPKKIRRYFALAPIITSAHLGGPLAALAGLADTPQSGKMTLDADATAEALVPTCRAAPQPCVDFYSTVGGTTTSLNATRTPVYLKHFGATSSARNYAHWGQMTKRGGLAKMYDFGTAALNQQYYGKDRPPAYKFWIPYRTPVYIFSGSADIIAPTADVSVIPKTIKSLAANVIIKEYAHFDLVYAKNIAKKVVNPIIGVIRKRDGLVGEKRNGGGGSKYGWDSHSKCDDDHVHIGGYNWWEHL